jgi:hypothetical protein
VVDDWVFIFMHDLHAAFGAAAIEQDFDTAPIFP